MKKILFILALLMLFCIFTMRDERNVHTFSDDQCDERCKRTYETLDDSCNFTFVYSDPHRLITQAVYSSAAGNIYVTDISDITDNSFEITFEAQGIITEENASFVSACIPYQDSSGKERLISSTIKVFPQDEFGAYYSFRTSEMREDGNTFSIEVYRKNINSSLNQQIKIELYPLYKISFSKQSQDVL